MWETVKLGDVCDFENGDRGENYPSKSVQTDVGIPFINAGHLSDDGFVDFKSMNFIPEERYEILGSGKTKSGDILFCLRGSLGKAAIVEGVEKGAIASSLVIVRPNASVLNTKYLLYYLKSGLCALEIQKYKGGAAQPNLSGKSLKNFVLPLPPLAEQKRIVAKLDAAFSEIDTAIAAAEKNAENAEALYKITLTEIYFGEGEVPSVTIGEIATIKGGKRLPKGHKVSDDVTDYPYIRVSDFTDNGTVDEETVKYIPKEVHEQISRYVISENDVYVSIAGTIGKTGVIPNKFDGANLTENAAKVVLSDDCLRDYFYFFTTTSSFNEQAVKQTRTAAQPKLALERLADVKLPLPTIEVQKVLIEKARQLKEISEKIKSIYEEKTTHLASLKSALLTAELASKVKLHE